MNPKKQHLTFRLLVEHIKIVTDVSSDPQMVWSNKVTVAAWYIAIAGIIVFHSSSDTRVCPVLDTSK